MEIKARMPGQIVDIKVKEGESVATRSVLAILEAMKMEQAIPSPKAGTITAVKVAVGDKVKSGQVLFVIE